MAAIPSIEQMGHRRSAAPVVRKLGELGATSNAFLTAVVVAAASFVAAPANAAVAAAQCAAAGSYTYCEGLGFTAGAPTDASTLTWVSANMTFNPNSPYPTTGDAPLTTYLARLNRAQQWQAELNAATNAAPQRASLLSQGTPPAGAQSASQPVSALLLTFCDIYPCFNQLVPDTAERQQQKDYYCGPGTMQMVGNFGGYAVSQATWADANHLKTESQHESAIADEVRLTNEKTNLDTKAATSSYGTPRPYALNRVAANDSDHLYFWANMLRPGWQGGPVLQHTMLTRVNYPQYGMARDHGGHLSVSFGNDYRNGSYLLRVFETYNEGTYVSGGASTGHAWWSPFGNMLKATNAHSASNVGT